MTRKLGLPVVLVLLGCAQIPTLGASPRNIFLPCRKGGAFPLIERCSRNKKHRVNEYLNQVRPGMIRRLRGR